MFAYLTHMCKKFFVADAATRLIAELKERFPAVDTLNALGIVYPQYWMQPDCLKTFPLHLAIISDSFAR